MFVLVIAWCIVGGGDCREELWPQSFPSIEACWRESQKQAKIIRNDRGEELIAARCIDKDTYEAPK